MYTELRLDKILQTIAKLEIRIHERIPKSGLSRVCGELHAMANGAQSRIDELAQPNRWIRAGVITAVVAFLAMIAYTISVVEWEYSKPNLIEVIQITEALINDLVLLGIALFFLFTLETRMKRRTVLRDLHQLRSIAHVVDMHQLTKDPSMIQANGERTENSPERTMTPFELQRYLDYCSEMFSLVGKLAAMYSEKLPEPDIVSAANDIEDLCTGMSRKVWQKMVTLE